MSSQAKLQSHRATAGVAQASPGRFGFVAGEKAGGETYTPKRLADFVAAQVVSGAKLRNGAEPLRVLDPAIGDGELLLSLLERLERRGAGRVEVYGFDTNSASLQRASRRLAQLFPRIGVHLEQQDFLDFVLQHGTDGHHTGNLFESTVPLVYDLIIANPPYVRTQIMGASQAQLLARQFGLRGRVDLYYAFVMGMARVLRVEGAAGIIVSNRFMTTRSGASIRRSIREEFQIRHVWDLGDTKLFEAAVLPAVLLLRRKNGQGTKSAGFTSIYTTEAAAEERTGDPVEALSKVGVVQVDDGRRFLVQHGELASGGEPDDIWRIATVTGEAWLSTVAERKWGVFGDIGKVRVGVKTCADDVFIRSDWSEIPQDQRPELLRPVTTHHVGRRYRAVEGKEPKWIVYPHEVANEQRRAVNLAQYPCTARYLEEYRTVLENRKYVLDAGRKWFEIWVPQDPDAWKNVKLVFRDISEKPMFWIDESGSVVNGDCYWLSGEKQVDIDLLWLACAVGNSTFIEAFYDHRFHNKLYAGRRRFITQYVEEFPLPDPQSAKGKKTIAKAKEVYRCVGTPKARGLELELDGLIWGAFGLPRKEVSG